MNYFRDIKAIYDEYELAIACINHTKTQVKKFVLKQLPNSAIPAELLKFKSTTMGEFDLLIKETGVTYCFLLLAAGEGKLRKILSQIAGISHPANTLHQQLIAEMAGSDPAKVELNKILKVFGKHATDRRPMSMWIGELKLRNFVAHGRHWPSPNLSRRNLYAYSPKEIHNMLQAFFKAYP